MNEFERAMQILLANSAKSFVRRILEPDKYPTIKNQDGSHSTHQMEWGEAGGKYYVYPRILLNQDGQLQDYGDQAWEHVSKSGNYIEFDNPDDAAWFSENYKHGWGGKPNNWPK